MTAAYWLIGRYIVEFEQEGRERANYGEEIVGRLSADLSTRFGRGFSVRNLWKMRAFFLSWQKVPTASAESGDHQKLQTLSGESEIEKCRQCRQNLY